MNAHGVGIYPYIEPHILHWPLPKGMLATWENINHTVMDCVANPEKYKHCSGDGNDCRGLCKMIAENAVVDNTVSSQAFSPLLVIDGPILRDCL